MSKKKEHIRGEIPDAQGVGVLTVCKGCGTGAPGTAPMSTARMQPCPRCGTIVCRVCAEDQPHLFPDGSVCELPAGQQPKVWGLEPWPHTEWETQNLGPEYADGPFPSRKAEDKQLRQGEE